MPESPRPDRAAIAIDLALRGEVPTQPRRLSRRSRHIVVDADFFDEDHAVVWFVRRGHGGEPVDEFWSLGRGSEGWVVCGMGGGEPGADLEKRPTMEAIAERNDRLGPFIDVCPFGFVSGGGSGFKKRPPYVHLHIAEEVAELRFSDREPKKVAAHGNVVLMYWAKKRPTISAVAGDGRCLGTFRPQRWKVQRRWMLRGWWISRQARPPR